MKGMQTVSSSVQEVPALDDLQSAAEPVWLWDAARRRIVWSNAPGLAFFGAETLFDLIDVAVLYILSKGVCFRLKVWWCLFFKC